MKRSGFKPRAEPMARGTTPMKRGKRMRPGKVRVKHRLDIMSAKDAYFGDEDTRPCQYCGHHEDLTFDHVIPRSKGGTTTWENVVAACSACNLRKSDRLPDDVRMWPAKMPFQPDIDDLRRNGRLFPPNYLHDSWMDYLYWDSVLEP